MTIDETSKDKTSKRQHIETAKCSDVMCYMFFEGHAYLKSEINIVDQCRQEVRPESLLFMFVKR